jgi:UPF0716 protein FxsA
MSLVKWAFLGLLALPAAELAVFVLAAWTMGWFWTIALFLGTSLLGLLLLRQSGRAHIDRFRQAVAQRGLRAIDLETPGAAPIIGGILLVVPGFITDALGLVLLAPPVRRAAAARLRDARRQRRGQGGRGVIDLPPDEWRNVSSRTIEDGTPRDP